MGNSHPVHWPLTDIFISTYPQEGSMVHCTLASMLMTGISNNINLVVNRPDSEYLKCYRHHKGVGIFPMSTQEWEAVKEKPVGWLATLNYMRALQMAANNAIVFEDDIILHDNWYERAMLIVEEIEKDGHEDYILSLYSPTLFTTRTNKSYAQFPVTHFAGCQGIYFPKRMIQGLLEFIQTNAMHHTGIKPDTVVGYWGELNKIPIFTPKHSLIQHIGFKSSMSSLRHDSPSFGLAKDEIWNHKDIRE
jgi:hypothetical protein